MEVKHLLVKIGAKKDEYEAAMKGISKSIQKHKEQFRKAGMAMTVAGGAIVGSLALIVKEASNAEETFAKFGTVFKSVAEKAEKAASDLAENYGLSAIAAKDMLGATGDLLTGLGVSADAALDLSETTQQLAVDLASFTNFSGGAKGASEALTKAMLGERESIKSLGIVITEEMVKEKLLAAGKDKLTGLSKKQAQAEATLAIAIEQSKNAMGDYARTSDSFANTQRRLQARLSDMAVALGQVLLPAATKIVGVITDIVTKMVEWTKAHPGLTKMLTVATAAVGGLLLILGPVLIILPKLVAGFGALKKVLGGVQLAMAKLRGISLASLGPVALLVAAVAALAYGYMKVKAAQDAYLESAKRAAEAEDNLFNKLKKAADQAGLTEKEFLKLRDAYNGNAAAMAMAIKRGKEGEKLQKSLADVSKEHKEQIEKQKAAVDVAVPSFDSFAGALDKTEKKLTAVYDAGNKLIPTLEDLGGVIKDLPPDMSKYGQTAKDVFDSLIPGYKLSKKVADEYGMATFKLKSDTEIFGTAVVTTNDKIAKGVKKVTEEIEKNWKRLFSTLGGLLQILADEIEGTLGNLISLIGLALDPIGDYLDNLEEGVSATAKGILSSIGPQLWGKISGSIGEMVSGAKNSFASLGSAIGATLGSIIPGVGTILGSIAGGFLGGLFGTGKTEEEKAREAALKAQKDIEAQIKQITKDFEHLGKISENTAKQIQEAAQEMDYWKAVALSFNDIIKDVGVNQENVNELWDQATVYLLRYANGLLSAQEATDILDDAFQQLLDGTKKLGEEGSEAMVDFIITAREAGLEIASVTEYVLGQLSRIPDAMSTLVDRFTQGWQVAANEIVNIEGRIEDATTRLQDLLAEQAEVELGSDEWHKLEKAIQDTRDEITGYEGSLAHWSEKQEKFIARTTDDVERLAMTTLLAFNSMRDSGMSFGDAITEMQDPLAQLAQLYEDFGLAIPKYLKPLFKIAEAREEHKKLYDEVEALTIIMDALRNSGIRNAEVFQGMTVDARQLFRQYQKAGLSEEESLWAMQDLLQSIYDSSELYGYSLDRNTQKIIDQAMAMGIVEEEQQSATEVMKEGFQGMIDGMKDGIEKLSKVIYYAMTGDFAAARAVMEEDADGAAAHIESRFRDTAIGVGDSFTGALDGVDMGKPDWNNTDLNIKTIRDSFRGALDGVNMGRPRFEETEPSLPGKTIRGAQTGVDEFLSASQLYMAHAGERVKIGKPAAFEEMTQLGNIYLTARFEINAVDAPSIRNIVRKKIGPEFIQWVKVGLGKTALKEALG